MSNAGRGTESVAPTVLVVDNYDSFAYNLVQDVGEVVERLGGGTDDVVVRRNDGIDVGGIRDLDPDGIVVSPGPGSPEEAGVSTALFDVLDYPTLGVCLGHQALCAANGAPVGHAEAVVHGKASPVTHDGDGLFEGLPDPVEVGRYHSLAVERDDLPDCLVETAYTASPLEGEAEAGEAETGEASGVGEAEAGEASGAAPDDAAPAGAGVPDDAEPGVVMGVRHRERPHYGVQFHPESILTEDGKQLVENFCLLCNTT